MHYFLIYCQIVDIVEGEIQAYMYYLLVPVQSKFWCFFQTSKLPSSKLKPSNNVMTSCNNHDRFALQTITRKFKCVTPPRPHTHTCDNDNIHVCVVRTC